MNTKHTPQAWDMYRRGTDTLIVERVVSDCTVWVWYANGNHIGLPMDLVLGCEFLGNVLALPELVKILVKLMIWANTHPRKATFSEINKAREIVTEILGHPPTMHDALDD